MDYFRDQVVRGLLPKKSFSLKVLIPASVIYFIAVLYTVLLHEIIWTGAYPANILFGGYREVSVNDYALMFTFILFVKILIEVIWLSTRNESLFNITTLRYLSLNQADPKKIYAAYLIYRLKVLFVFNMLYLLPIVIILYLKYQSFIYPLLTSSYILLISILILILSYDLLYFLIKNSVYTLTLLLLLLIFIPSFISITDQAVATTVYSQLLNNFGHLLPDPLSLNYQYALHSFNGAYSEKKIFYPCITIAMLILLNLGMSEKMTETFIYNRYAKNFKR